MQYYRCKCGDARSFGSMSPEPCFSCKKCNTTLVQHPDDHRAPEPHDFYTELVETDDGGSILTRCRWCFRTKREILTGKL